MEVKVEVSRDGKNFMLFNEYEGFVAEKVRLLGQKLIYAAVKAQYFRITPKYQGWGNQWGEVEFWEINS